MGKTMPTIIVVMDEVPDEIATLSSTGSILDLSLACKSIRSSIEEALGPSNPVIYSDFDRLHRVVKNVGEDPIIILDVLALHMSLDSVINDMLGEFASQVAASMVAVSPPLIRRGFYVSVEDSHLAGQGGGMAFAGIVVAKRSAIEKFRVTNWVELLDSLRGARAYYVRNPWIRLEKAYDILLYLMLKLAAMRNQRISSEAKISPTAVIEGPVYIGRGVHIDHYAVIKGPALLCDNAFVGLHATVRGFTSLEPGSRIGAYSEAYVAYLGPRATLSSHVYITGSVIGEGARIEPFVVTKVLYGREAVEKLGLLAPFPWEVRAGAIIEAGARVAAGTVLQPFTRAKRL